VILQMPTGMYRDCTTGALKADGSPQDPACFDDYDAVYYHKWADKCPIQDDPLCPTHHPGSDAATGAMSTFYLSASFSLRKHPRPLFLHAPRDPFCICSRLSGSNLCDVCVCTYVCVYTCASGTLCLSVFSIHLRVNAAFYHPALTVESTTGCSSAADCDCPTEGGWWPGWCDQGNCWYVRPSSLEFSFPLSLVRATVTRYPLFEIMR
jgi:hypothetical protein